MLELVWLVLLLLCFCFKLVIGEDEYVLLDDYDDAGENDHDDDAGVAGLTSALLLLQAGHR